MNFDETGKLVKRIAIVAKYPFYFEDARIRLSDLDIQIVWATEILQIEKQINEGTIFDFIFFPHYSKLVPSKFTEENNCVGFHTGDLPSDRGGSPIQNKILKGEYNTWVSAIKLNDDLDAGDIICRQAISLEHGDIEYILKKISAIVADLLRMIMTENPIPTPQRGEISVFSRLTPQVSELKIDGLDIRQIYDRIRMLDGLDYPQAYIELGGRRILLSNAELQNNRLVFVSRIEEDK